MRQVCDYQSETGELTKEQEQWIEALEKAGQEVFVWKPSDWDLIVEVLI